VGVHTQRWGPNRGAWDGVGAEGNPFGFSNPTWHPQVTWDYETYDPRHSFRHATSFGLDTTEKDMLTYAGAGVAGALIARHFAQGALGMLLGGAGGVAVAAFLVLKKAKTA